MLTTTLGWLGTMGTFGAYVLLSRGWLASHSLTYSMLNVTGGLLAACAGAAYGAWPIVASNLVWAAVGLHTAGRTLMAGQRVERFDARTVVTEPADPTAQDCLV